MKGPLVFADKETNLVYLSDQLPTRHPSVFQGVTNALAENGKPFELIQPTVDIWCRDYLPIQVAENEFVQFRYAPDYLQNPRSSHLMADGDAYRHILELKDSIRSEIVADGGNFVRWKNKVIMTDKIFAENPGCDPDALTKQIRELLKIDQLIIVPAEPGDMFGHTDGIVRFIDEKTVLLNDYGKVDPAFGEEVDCTLKKAGLETVAFPYCPKGFSSHVNMSAVGCYINFLQVRGLVLVPTFSIKGDGEALKIAETVFYDSRVLPIDCRTLAPEGGVLNCISWNGKASS
jgi:agmatine deiminase